MATATKKSVKKNDKLLPKFWVKVRGVVQVEAESAEQALEIATEFFDQELDLPHLRVVAAGAPAPRNPKQEQLVTMSDAPDLRKRLFKAKAIPVHDGPSAMEAARACLAAGTDARQGFEKYIWREGSADWPDGSDWWDEVQRRIDLLRRTEVRSKSGIPPKRKR